jgi:hypothetical protein
MKPVPAEIAYLYEAFREYADTLLSSWEGAAGTRLSQNPKQLVDAMAQLAGVLRNLEAGEQPDEGGRDVDTLCEYGLQLLNDLRDVARQLKLDDTAHSIENLCLPLAVWGARRGAEIRELESVVNAIAYFANRNQFPEVMQQLLAMANEVYEAVSPQVSEDRDKSQAMRPWRLLLLNRAIIATRTLQPTLMEPVFDNVVEHLPEDAARFFAEGMEQMDIIGYPPRVREIMTRYFQAFGTPRLLH